MKRIFALTALAVFTTLTPAKTTFETVLNEISRSIHTAIDKAPPTAQIENAFSPDGGGEALVLKVINTSQQSIRLAAYSFTSPIVVRALIDARKRGVDVRVVVDNRSNVPKSGKGKGIAALNLLVNAGVPARTIRTYAIFHDKTIVSDGKHVQTGSFNYSLAAAKSNSENVLVIWNNPDIAESYLKHWQNRYDQGVDYVSTY